jgi:methionine sulfoxide reductase heme-binding subunit
MRNRSPISTPEWTCVRIFDRQLRVNQLIKILGRKLFALTVLIGIGVWFLVLPAFTGNLGANPLEKLLHQSGEIAIWILGTVLALTPLRVLFPHSRIVTALNRHRRAIGVAACLYGLMHFSFHVLYEGGWEGSVRSLSKPFIWFGATGLIILVLLAVTSNQFSIRVLGNNWKRLHRLAYVAAALLIYHQAIAGKGHWAIARWLLFPLATLQLARLIKTAVQEKHRNTALRSVAKQVARDIESSAGGAASRRLPESASDHSQRSPMRQARANANRRCFHPA